MEDNTARGDAKHQTARPIVSWMVIYKPPAFGNPLNDLRPLRLSVTYLDGKVRTLAPSFRDRLALDKYVERFHPNFVGKEIVDLKSDPVG